MTSQQARLNLGLGLEAAATTAHADPHLLHACCAFACAFKLHRTLRAGPAPLASLLRHVSASA